MNRETIKLIADIIKSEMSLNDDQIIIYNQKFNIPDFESLFISVGLQSFKSFGNRRSYEDRSGVFFEVQDLSQQEIISIDIYSRNDEARLRKEEVLMSLNSTLAQQTQEENSFHISRIPIGFNDISEVEASARLNRYNLSIAVLSWYKKEKIVPYYDNFDNVEITIND